MAMSMSLGTLSVNLRANAQQFERTMQRTAATMQATAATIKTAGITMSIAVTAPLTLMGRAAVKSFSAFDDAMTKSTAIMGNLSDEMRKEMEQTAVTLSNQGTQSAKELADSYYFLASAGLDAKQSLAALPVVQQFATAGAFDMAKATDLLTDAQSALGLSSRDAAANQTNMVSLSDRLVRANTLANASVEQFSIALTAKAGTAMKSLNMDMDEGIAILAAYADQGIKAELAGNSFSRMARLMIKGINDNKESFEKMNIPYQEFASTGKNVTAVLDGITKATAGMGPAQKAATLEMLGFEARAQDAILPLLGLTDRLKGYTAELRKAGGFTEDVANNQLKSFSAQMKIMWNRVSNMGMTIGKVLAPMLATLSEKISELTKWWAGLSKGWQRVIVYGGIFLTMLGPMLLIISKFIALGGAVAAAFAWAGGMLPAALAWIGLKLVALGGFLSALFTPIFLVKAAVVALGVIIIRQTSLWDKAVKNLGYVFQWWSDLVSGLVERFGKTWEGIKAAIAADDLGLAFSIVLAQIEMEFLRAINTIGQAWGDWFDKLRDMWRDLVMAASIVAEAISNAFWKAIQFVADKVIDLAVTFKMAYNRIQRATGAMTDSEEIRANNAARQWRDKMKGGVSKDIQAQMQQSTAFYQGKIAEVAGRDRTPFAAGPAKNLKEATQRWTSLVAEATKKAAMQAKPPAASTTKEVVNQAQRQAVAATAAPVEAAGTGASLSRGAFLSSQLSGAGSVTKAQDTRESLLKVSEEQLAETKKQTAVLGAASSGTVLG